MKLLRQLFLLLLLSPGIIASAQQAPAAPQAAPATPPQAAAPAAEEYHVTAAEAKELFRSLDDSLPFASDRTGLPILHSVKKKLATREEVYKYIEKRLKEQGNGERFDRSAQSLKKLGLLPRDFNLRQYMLGLYKEQVEGWYDAHNKTVYLLDWVDPELQKPVMAHELVHALQDQSFGLEKWLNVAKDSSDPTTQMLLDEQRVARQSVIEGQAMVVLYDYELAPTGQTVTSAPALVESMRPSMLDDESTPMYGKAPIFLREAMLFPYSYGTDFVIAVLAKNGKQAAFAGVFERPPLDTRQVMEPATYFAAEPQPQLKVAPLEKLLGPDWSREDFSGIGEIDLRVILRQWGGKQVAAKLSPAWRGGYYMALASKKAPRDAPLPLLLLLDFATPDAANQFASVYRASLAQRYNSVQPAQSPNQWTTNEGFVSISVDGARVVALESFTPDDAARLRAALLPTTTAPR